MNRPVCPGSLLIAASLRPGPRTHPLSLLLPVSERLPNAQPAALLHVRRLTRLIECARQLSRSKAAASINDALEELDSEMEGRRGDRPEARPINRSCAGLLQNQICAASRPALRPGPSVPAETAARDSPAPAAVANLSSLPQNCPSRSAQPE